MTLPGFTAETSLAQTNKIYRITAHTVNFGYKQRLLPMELRGRCPERCETCRWQFGGEEYGWFRRCVTRDCDEYYRSCTPPPCPPGRCVWPACDGYIGSDGQCFWIS